MLKRIISIACVFIVVVMIVSVVTVFGIYINGEILRCEYYAGGQTEYHDVSLLGNGKIYYTTYRFYGVLSEENIKKTLKEVSIDPVSQRLVGTKKELYLKNEDRVKVLLILLRLQFTNMLDHSQTSENAPRVRITTLGKTYTIIPENEYSLSDELSNELADIIKNACGIY